MADEPKGPDPEGAPADRDASGRFLPGNSLWAAANALAGRKRKFATPESLLEAAAEYLEWVRENPLYRDEVGWYQGKAEHEPVRLVRTASLDAMFLHLGIVKSTWYEWKTARPDLAEAMEFIGMAIADDQLQKGLTGQANSGIIAKLRGLADRTELSGPGGGPIETINQNMTPQEAAQAYAATLTGDEG